MDMFLIMGNIGDPNAMNQEVQKKLEKAKLELRRRLMDTDQIKFGGVFNVDGLKLMRQGGDVELQMVALLCAQFKLGDAISNDWESQDLTSEEGMFRYLAINHFAREFFAESEK
jgi:hypothetical protein